MLAAMQQQFQRWLVAADDAGLRDSVSDATGLGAYQNNYWVQLVNGLNASFPLVRRLLGATAFVDAAREYIKRTPPSSWTLDAYGADFPQHLHAQFPHVPHVGELAAIEWAMGEAFVATDADPLDTEQLPQLDWDTARLALVPSLRLLTQHTHAAELWSTLQQDDVAPELAVASATPKPVVSTRTLLIWRQGFRVRLNILDDVEQLALATVREHGNFSAVCSALVARLGEEQGIARAGQWLADALAGGFLSISAVENKTA